MRFEIPEGRITLGRDECCDLTLEDPKVSRIHCFLIRRNDTLVCIDNHSTNGTYLNGKRLKPDISYPVKNDDILLVGGGEYQVAGAQRHPSVQFSAGEPMVTNVVQSDQVARKFQAVFESYRKGATGAGLAAAPEAARADGGGAELPDTVHFPDLQRNQRLMQSLETLYKMSRRVSAVMPLDELFAEMKKLLFDVFDSAENLVIMIWDEDLGDYIPRLVANSRFEADAPVVIPQSVFYRAMTERVTLVANDAANDSRFSQSDSIIGLSIQSVMCAPLVAGGRTLGAIYVDNRKQATHYEEADAELLTAFASQAAIAIDNARLMDTLQRSYQQTLLALVTAIEAKDEYTRGHSQRVAEYAVGIALELNFPQERVDLLRTAAELHDIGKIGIKDLIIQKPDRLSDEEFREIKNHVITGERIVAPITYLSPVLPAIRNHHERWDGKGYPDGQKGEQIALEARILAVADAFDAMTTKRTYNNPMTMEQALKRVREASGTQFDPQVVAAFSRYIERKITSDPGEAQDAVKPSPASSAP